MKKNVTYTYQLSLADVKEAIEQYMETKGEYIDVTSMEPIVKLKENDEGNYEYDRVNIFAGIKIKAEMV